MRCARAADCSALRSTAKALGRRGGLPDEVLSTTRMRRAKDDLATETGHVLVVVRRRRRDRGRAASRFHEALGTAGRTDRVTARRVIASAPSAAHRLHCHLTTCPLLAPKAEEASRSAFSRSEGEGVKARAATT